MAALLLCYAGSLLGVESSNFDLYFGKFPLPPRLNQFCIRRIIERDYGRLSKSLFLAAD